MKIPCINLYNRLTNMRNMRYTLLRTHITDSRLNLTVELHDAMYCKHVDRTVLCVSHAAVIKLAAQYRQFLASNSI
jgi:hypothetical protein